MLVCLWCTTFSGSSSFGIVKASTYIVIIQENKVTLERKEYCTDILDPIVCVLATGQSNL